MRSQSVSATDEIGDNNSINVKKGRMLIIKWNVRVTKKLKKNPVFNCVENLFQQRMKNKHRYGQTTHF